ncbi:MAG TPA: tripartite tricarboxylate transporter TctB family protein [Candidatus Methylomirabilis sp.]|nr:tripartite tricarboxylate transporter TctB family protein [Candidatus Methylomirabilis sp.]HSD50163.1 tripartite tricarboxylate transporter TctB family protein [Candidatus Methylomirabilis sp.]
MRVNDTLVGAGFVTAGALVIAGTLNYPQLETGYPGPALFPRILGGLMILFGGSLGLFGLRSRDVWASDWLRGRSLLNALFVLAGTIAYMLFADDLGFLPTASLILFGLMWWLHVRPLTAAAVAICLSLGTYFLFAHVLLVPLPRGPLGW